jgi:WD40 repeat protein
VVAAAASGVGGAAAAALAGSRRYISAVMRAPPAMHSVVATPDASLLLTSSLGNADAAVRVWRLHWGGQPAVAAGAAAPSGRPSACLPLVQLHRTLTGHDEAVVSLALSPCGRLLYTGSNDRTVRVWSTADWHCLRVLRGHGGGVKALAPAPDGRVLYSAAADNTIRVGAPRPQCLAGPPVWLRAVLRQAKPVLLHTC